jgi:hypothetical protein
MRHEPAIDYSGAGYVRAETTVSCVITRFRLRSFWWMIPFYFAYRRVRNGSSNVTGLLRSAFLVQDARTCYTFSLWSSEGAILEFNARVAAHAAAGNTALHGTFNGQRQQCEIWSAQFRLWAVSPHCHSWDDLDLRSLIRICDEPSATAESSGVR